MIKFIKKFRSEEEGAVTVDWVVLTAAVVGLAVAAITTIADTTDTIVENTATHMGTGPANP
jgi:Flp pilus assembly pilin Flp